MVQAQGARIREARVQRGLSQAQLGEPRYSGSYISHIENGRRSPGTDVLAFIAARLGLEPGALDSENLDFADLDVISLVATARRLLETQQWDRAVRACERAVAIACGVGREPRCWEADFLLATAQMAAGRYTEAAERAAQLVERPVVVALPELRTQAGILASRAYRACGRLADAAQHARAAAESAQDVDPAILATALIALLSAVVMAKPDANVTELEHRLESLIDRLDAPDAANVAWALGNSAFAHGDLALGLTWHARGAELCDPRIDARAWARLRQSTAFHLITLGGDFELAERLFDECRGIITLLGNAGDLADLRLVEAHLRLRRGEPGVAAELLEHLALEATALDDVRLRGEVMETLASARFALGQVASAKVALRQAAAHFEAAQAPDRALAVWHRYAEME